jgi:GrpB-like predicted nucleotidyltransferase (UPF0157 family)
MSERILEVVDYNPLWVKAFELERSLVEEAMKGIVVEISHIGSTSIPGLAAKPIIDILVAVTDLDVLDQRTKKMELLGYKAKGENGIVGRRYFQKGGNQRTHHLHAFKSGDENLVRHKALRDYLLHHREVVLEYEKLKKELVAICSKNDVSGYQEGKSSFLQKHKKLALQWYRAECEKK